MNKIKINNMTFNLKPSIEEGDFTMLDIKLEQQNIARECNGLKPLKKSYIKGRNKIKTYEKNTKS